MGRRNREKLPASLANKVKKWHIADDGRPEEVEVVLVPGFDHALQSRYYGDRTFEAIPLRELYDSLKEAMKLTGKLKSGYGVLYEGGTKVIPLRYREKRRGARISAYDSKGRTVHRVHVFSERKSALEYVVSNLKGNRTRAEEALVKSEKAVTKAERELARHLKRTKKK